MVLEQIPNFALVDKVPEGIFKLEKEMSFTGSTGAFFIYAIQTQLQQQTLEKVAFIFNLTLSKYTCIHTDGFFYHRSTVVMGKW